MHTPEARSAGVADRPRAGLRSVHGVEAWTWRCGDGGGSETASPLGPSGDRTARPPGTLALQSFKGTGSSSIPKITSAPAAMAPAEKPPSPANKSITFIELFIASQHPTEVIEACLTPGARSYMYWCQTGATYGALYPHTVSSPSDDSDIERCQRSSCPQCPAAGLRAPVSAHGRGERVRGTARERAVVCGALAHAPLG